MRLLKAASPRKLWQKTHDARIVVQRLQLRGVKIADADRLENTLIVVLFEEIFPQFGDRNLERDELGVFVSFGAAQIGFWLQTTMRKQSRNKTKLALKQKGVCSRYKSM